MSPNHERLSDGGEGRGRSALFGFTRSTRPSTWSARSTHFGGRASLARRLPFDVDDELTVLHAEPRRLQSPPPSRPSPRSLPLSAESSSCAYDGYALRYGVEDDEPYAGRIAESRYDRNRLVRDRVAIVDLAVPSDCRGLSLIESSVCGGRRKRVDRFGTAASLSFCSLFSTHTPLKALTYPYPVARSYNHYVLPYSALVNFVQPRHLVRASRQV